MLNPLGFIEWAVMVAAAIAGIVYNAVMIRKEGSEQDELQIANNHL